MSLILYYHPLSSFCQKVLIALYENATPFTAHVVDLADGEPPFADVMPLGDNYPTVAGYFERLKARPSYARVLQEAQPYLHLFPKERVA
jgi:glutathione S-transferase